MSKLLIHIKDRNLLFKLKKLMLINLSIKTNMRIKKVTNIMAIDYTRKISLSMMKIKEQFIFSLRNLLKPVNQLIYQKIMK